MSTPNKNDKNFVQVRCNCCNSLLFEISKDSIGNARVKCRKCKHGGVIPLQSHVNRHKIVSPASHR